MRFIEKKILITGGAGFVGSNLCCQLLKEGPDHIVIVDNLLSSEKENVPTDERVLFIEGSITNNEVLREIGTCYDYVFHLATYHGNQASIMDPISDHENNTYTTLKLCEHFKATQTLNKLVYASAGCTVSKKTYNDVSATIEDAEISLYHDSPYQISKLIGEFYGNYYSKQYRLPFVKARFQNVYGPREILGAGKWRNVPATVWRNVIPTFIWKALHKQALQLENAGRATRDFIYVDDIVEGLIACALHGRASEVYNLASGVETSIKKLAEMINKMCDNTAPLEICPARPWDHSGKRFGSTEKAAAQLSFKAKCTLHEGLYRTVEWTRNHLSLIRRTILKHHDLIPEVSIYI